MIMQRVNVLCEGTTEYNFVIEVLYPYFISKGIILNPYDLGGGFSYASLKYQVIKWLNYEQAGYVTTMVDLYGMNDGFPEYTIQDSRPSLEKVVAIETAIKKDILTTATVHNEKFLPYIQLYEFEALLFSDPSKLEEWLSLEHKIPANIFANIRNNFDTPEDINDSPHTAPSKRITRVVPSYNKTAEGITIASDIGLQKIRQECPHFNAWLTQLENLVE
jgi:hypothetical protein